MARFGKALLAVATLVFVGAQLPAAQISFIDQFNNTAYTLTSATQPVAGSATYFFDGQIVMQNAGDFSAGNVATPGGQPSNGTNGGANPDMALLSSTVFQYASPSLSQATYNAEFPAGTYNYTGTDTPSQTVAVTQGATVYAASIPYITDFTGLQGMNATSSFNVTWNSFTGA